MNNNSIIIERSFNVPVNQVWTALTDNNEMKQWYFDLPEFRAERGFKFDFKGGPADGKQYLHHCEVTEAIPNRTISYSWSYEGYEGNSQVNFELFEIEGKTLLRVTHEGLESFPQDNPDFQKQNFEKGWDSIVNESLKNYLEKAQG